MEFKFKDATQQQQTVNRYPLPVELRIFRDFLALNVLSLLAFSGYLAYVNREQYFWAVLKTLFAESSRAYCQY